MNGFPFLFDVFPRPLHEVTRQFNALRLAEMTDLIAVKVLP